MSADNLSPAKDSYTASHPTRYVYECRTCKVSMSMDHRPLMLRALWAAAHDGHDVFEIDRGADL